MQNEFIDLILEEKKSNKTILMSSHMFEEVEKTCHRVAIIKKGRLVTVDEIENLKASKTKRFSITFFDNDAAIDFSKKGFDIDNLKGNCVDVLIHSNLNEFLSVLANYQILDLTEKSQRLEEIFLHYYGGAAND